MTLILCVSCSASVSRAKPHPLCQGRDGRGAARSGPGPTSSAFSYASATAGTMRPTGGLSGAHAGQQRGAPLGRVTKPTNPRSLRGYIRRVPKPRMFCSPTA